MKNSQFYFIQQSQTQNYDYNNNEKVKDLLSNLEVPQPRCVGSITKIFFCITRTVKHKYIYLLLQ